MDLILTLARNTCYFNNSIRLIIVSATMNDEPIYRSYYQYINDNLVYPIKQPIPEHPFIDGLNNFLPLAIYMDRRFHISPPGETTQYTITEVYQDLLENQVNDKGEPDELKNSIIAQKKVLR